MGVEVGGKLQDLFGERDIGDMVENFDFSKAGDDKKHDYLHVGLAPAYGTLTGEAVRKMDDKRKIMIASTVNLLESLPALERNWDKVTEAMARAALLELDRTQDIHRVDKLTKRSSSDYKFDGSPDAAIVKEVEAWFKGLIKDPDVVDSTKFDPNTLANIVAQTGVIVDSFEQSSARQELQQKTLVDIGVLRFPDITNPVVKVCRIQLTVWSDSSRTSAHQEDDSGITGECYYRQYYPRAARVDGMPADSLIRESSEVDALFPV